MCTLDHLAPYQATFPTVKTPWPPLRETVPTSMRQRNVRDFAVFKSKGMVASDLLQANRHRPLRPWTLPWCSTPSQANLAGNLGLPPRYGSKNPFSFMDLQDVQELTNFFERRVSAYQMGVVGDVVFDEAF